MRNDLEDATVESRSTTAEGPNITAAARIAGGALLLLAALAAFGNLVVVEGLITQGDAARTAADITGSKGLFRLGVASLYVAAVLDLVIAWALLRLFSPVDRELSRLSAWFRLAYAGVFLVAISQLAGIPALLQTAGNATGLTLEQRQGQALLKAESFNDIWFTGLILFGIHLAVAGYLAWRSGFVPRVIGVLLMVAGGGYVVDSLVRLFTQDAPALSSVTFLGEFLLAVWLVARGHRIVLIGARA